MTALNNSRRIAVIGAGSAVFSLNVVRDLCMTDSLSGSTVVLMDLNAERLGIVFDLAKRYAAELQRPLSFEKTLDRTTALNGANFVINTALAGGHVREESERSLAEARGYYRGIHPGPEVFHQYDLSLAIARDIERICPDAWLIQSSNPVYDICTLLTRQTKVKVIGLCHGPFGGIQEIARVLNLDPHRISFDAPGVNHCVWMTRFEYDGRDAFPILDQWIENESEEYWKTWHPRYSDNQMSPGAIHLYKFFGLLPLGDTARALWPEAWWYHKDLATKMHWWGPLGGFNSEIGWQNYLDELTNTIEAIQVAAADTTKLVSDIFPVEKAASRSFRSSMQSRMTPPAASSST